MAAQESPAVGDRVRLRRHSAPTAVRHGVAEVIAVEDRRHPPTVTVSVDAHRSATEDRWRRWPLASVVVVKRATGEQNGAVAVHGAQDRQRSQEGASRREEIR